MQTHLASWLALHDDGLSATIPALLARIYEVLPLLCTKCGGEMKIIAFITETVAIREILGHLGEPSAPPTLNPARGQAMWELPDAEFGESEPPQPASDLQFGQRIAW